MHAIAGFRDEDFPRHYQRGLVHYPGLLQRFLACADLCVGDVGCMLCRCVENKLVPDASLDILLEYVRNRKMSGNMKLLYQKYDIEMKRYDKCVCNGWYDPHFNANIEYAYETDMDKIEKENEYSSYRDIYHMLQCGIYNPVLKFWDKYKLDDYRPRFFQAPQRNMCQGYVASLR